MTKAMLSKALQATIYKKRGAMAARKINNLNEKGGGFHERQDFGFYSMGFDTVSGGGNFLFGMSKISLPGETAWGRLVYDFKV